MGYWGEISKRSAFAAAESVGFDTRDRIMIKALAAIAILFALAFWGSEDASRDEVVARLALAAIVIFIFPLLYLWNLVRVPPKLHNEKVAQIGEAQAATERIAADNADLRNKLDELTRPNFSLEIQNAIIGDLIQPLNSSRILLYVVVINRGTPSAAIESTWKLNVVTADNRVFRADAQTLVGATDFPFRQQGEKRRYLREDGVDLRASQPIPRLGYASGVLYFLIRGLDSRSLLDDGTNILLSVQDANGTTYSAQENVATLRTRTDETRFMPGLSHPMPIPIDQP